MRIAALVAALLLLALPVAGRAAVPYSGCPDVLVGDSLAVGMGPYARTAGFQVLARTGIGLNWLRAQSPRCARRVVVVIGTNDLRGLDAWSAEAYPDRLAAIMSRWDAQEITWATPGCFPYDESLERGSEALSQVLAREPLVRVGSGRGYMRVHSGRPARCSYISGDGIHPSGAGYRAWWASLSQAIGVAPDGPAYTGPDLREAYDSRSVRSVHARAGRSARYTQVAHGGRNAHSAQVARSTRAGRPTQLARNGRPTGMAQQARSGRTAQPVQQARASTRSTQQARSERSMRSVLQARSDRTARPVQQARSERTIRQADRVARPAPQAHAAQQARSQPSARPSRDPRPPVPSRQASAAPIRRT